VAAGEGHVEREIEKELTKAGTAQKAQLHFSFFLRRT